MFCTVLIFLAPNRLILCSFQIILMRISLSGYPVFYFLLGLSAKAPLIVCSNPSGKVVLHLQLLEFNLIGAELVFKDERGLR